MPPLKAYPPRKCERCETEFKPHVITQKWCGPACREAAAKERNQYPSVTATRAARAAEAKPLNEDEVKRLRQLIAANPILFIRNYFQCSTWPRQDDMLKSIALNQRTAIKSAHGCGKTFILARIALWWLCRYPDGAVYTTAPTFRQVKTQIWREIGVAADNCIYGIHKPNLTDLRLRGSNNFAMGLSTNKAHNFQGIHGPHDLIIADEASGIKSDIWDAIAGAMSGGRPHIVMAGNPTIPSGAFYEAFTSKRGLWNCISVDAFDSPNLAGLGETQDPSLPRWRRIVNELLNMDPREGGPLDQNPQRHLPTKRWVRDQYLDWWHGDEASSPNWVSRVRGEFPLESINAMFKFLWLERAKANALYEIENGLVPPIEGRRLIAGIDVGGNMAETVCYICEVGPKRKRIVDLFTHRGIDWDKTLGVFLERYRDRLMGIRFDDISVDKGMRRWLEQRRFPHTPVNVGLPAPSNADRGVDDLNKRFVNLKAMYYTNLSRLFQDDLIDGFMDEVTYSQLSQILYETDDRGRIKIESKDDAAKRGLPSPDRAEALMLALGEAPAQIAYTSAAAWEKQQRERSYVPGLKPHPEDSPLAAGRRFKPGAW